ncbi:hypothetical protein [Streptomyces sp. NPDC085479]|uniref:hypothetical protein n=1 Tax=Streptomyces sp. NPDC085479 TaxID=3365726 RepID=UPI0037D8A7D8
MSRLNDTLLDVAALVSAAVQEDDPSTSTLAPVVDDLIDSIEQAPLGDQLTAFLRVTHALLGELADALNEDPQETWQRLAAQLAEQE